MKYFVISLKRTPQRLEQFFAWNPCRDMVEIFEAIDGQEMTWRKLEELGVVKDRLQSIQLGQSALQCRIFFYGSRWRIRMKR
jgi:hypothetical protein